MRPTGSKRPAFRLLAVLAATLLAAVLAELAFRHLPLGGRPQRGTALASEYPLMELGPDFRNRDYEPEKEPGVFRILAVGDSCAWGAGLHPEDAFPDRLSVRLAEHDPQRRYEVVNWSSPGWNTVRQFDSLRRRLDGWAPDLLLVGFVLNDAEPGRSRELEPMRTDLERRASKSALGGWLHAHSRLYHRLFEAAENLRMRRALDLYYHSLYDGESWVACRRALRRMRVMAARRQIPIVVVVFPIFDSQLDGRYRYRDLHQLVLATAAELDIRAFDLLPIYEGIDARRLAVEPFTDPHPSELAHRLAADAILWYLVRQRLIPTPQAPRPQEELDR